MLNQFSDNRPSALENVLSFIEAHDPIRRWAYNYHLPESAPYWLMRVHEDGTTAFVRDVYERGIIEAARDVAEGLYNYLLALTLFEAAGALDPNWYGEFEHPCVIRENDRKRKAEALAKADAEQAEQAPEPPSLFMLMLDLWDALETDSERQEFLTRAIDHTPIERPRSNDFCDQVYHAAGDDEVMFRMLADDPLMKDDERNAIYDGWRARGLDYLADYYIPLVAQRRGLTSSNPDTLDKAA